MDSNVGDKTGDGKVVELACHIKECHDSIDDINGCLNTLLGCIPQEKNKRAIELVGTINGVVSDAKRLVLNLKVAVERMRGL